MKKMYVTTIILILAITTIFLLFYKDEGSISVKYLNSYGYEVATSPISVEIYPIPTEFDDTLYDYNLMQLSGGFDLSLCRGKNATRYTYKITNLPGLTLYANIFFLNGKIIASDIVCPDLGGFISPMVHIRDFKKNHSPATTDAVIP